MKGCWQKGQDLSFGALLGLALGLEMEESAADPGVEICSAITH